MDACSTAGTDSVLSNKKVIIKTMQTALEGVELNELLLKKQLADIQEELISITNDYIDVKSL